MQEIYSHAACSHHMTTPKCVSNLCRTTIHTIHSSNAMAYHVNKPLVSFEALPVQLLEFFHILSLAIKQTNSPNFRV